MDIYSNYEKSIGGVQEIDKSPELMRNLIMGLENTMLDMSDGTELDNFPVEHFFAPGVYARQMFLPADSAIVGKIHKHSHLNIISHGKVVVATDEGVKEIDGPCIFTSPAGVKRAVSVIEDTLWTTIHLTEETDVDKIEAEVIAKTFTEFESFKESKRIGEES